MIKNVLVIDDDPDKRILAALEEDLNEEINLNSSVSFEVKLHLVNPNEFIGSNKDLASLFNHLDKKFLDDSLEMLLCDFNLHVKHKDLAFLIIHHVRTKNRACSIMLHTGTPLKELTRLNHADLAKAISVHISTDNRTIELDKLEKSIDRFIKAEVRSEELLAMVVESQISEIIDKPKFTSKAIELIKKPSLLLQIETELLKYSSVIFKDGNDKLDGKSLGEIATDVRKQTDVGKYFIEHIIQFSVNNISFLHR